MSFVNEVVPIFTKLGCNAGACHGKASGQNGFKLSLLGFEPDEDFEALVLEARGRRLFPAAPAQSLLLRKATAAVAHGGGKRLELGSPFYQVLLRWIAQGTLHRPLAAPIVNRIEVLPHRRRLERGSQQQLAVVAHCSDGSTIDVTRLTQFESSEPRLAEVSSSGLVTIGRQAGMAAVLSRFQTHVGVFQATVPLGEPLVQIPAVNNFVDELVFRQLQHLGLPPSEPCDDATFLRRATIDIAGRLPTKEEVEQFLRDQDPFKHGKLIDRLLASPEYADYFANKWGAILRNRRVSEQDDPRPTMVFREWIRDSLAQNRPYDQFVRALMTAQGTEVHDPCVIWYRAVNEVSSQVEDTSQLFLGQRLGCARRHHHPLEKWSQQDYYGLGAFFLAAGSQRPSSAQVKGQKKGDPLPCRRWKFDIARHGPGRPPEDPPILSRPLLAGPR